MTSRPDLALPRVEQVAALPPEVLPGFLCELAALVAAAGARLAATGQANGQTKAEPPYTLVDAAHLLHKSPAWLRRQAKAGAIPCAKKVGRSWLFPRAEFARFCQRRQVG